MDYSGQILTSNMNTNNSLWKTFLFAISLFIITIIIYILLVLGYIPFLNRSIYELENRINNLDQRAPQQDIKERFVVFYSQAVGINSLFRSHTTILPFFIALESKTKNNVGLSDVNIDVLERTATIEGFASAFDVLAGQVILYENIDNIDEVVLSSANAFEQFVKFNLRMNFNNNFFKLNYPQKSIEENMLQETAPMLNIN